MTRASKRAGALIAVAAVAVGLAACSSSGNSGAAKVSTQTSNQKPVAGGTLKIIAASGPDHLDTVPAYYTVDYELERLYARQLVSYQTVPYTSTSSAGWKTDTTPAADVATEVPTTANGGITDGGAVYTFHIKQGVDWDTTPARQVTADDFVREFKAFFNPISPVGNPTYYTSAIAGLQAYSNAESAYFAKIKSPTAAQIANFQNTHNISGIKAVNAMTIQFTLTHPTTDFLYMLAMPFASARPAEYDSYLPDSLTLDQHIISDGPYSLSSYVPGKSITFTRNPAWKQSTDSLRHDYPASIVETINGASAQTQLADIEAGQYNLTSGDTAVNPADIPSLISGHKPWFQLWSASDSYPYIVFNLRSPNDGGAIQNVNLRKAIEYGVDKLAAVRAVGGTQVATITNTVIPPGNTGYVNYNLYPDDNGLGSTSECKTYLGKAGDAKGVTLNYMYENDSVDTRIYQTIEASLAPCGITLKGVPEPGSSIFVDLGNAPQNNKSGTWDLGQAIWYPDWYGDNGRTVIQALFQGPNCVINTVNDGCYDNATVNSDITKAEDTTSLTQAGSYWHAADEQIMKDAAIVPIMSQNSAEIASSNVRGVLPNGTTYQTALYDPNVSDPDLANVWLANS